MLTTDTERISATWGAVNAFLEPAIWSANEVLICGSDSAGENRKHGLVHHLPSGEQFEFLPDLAIATDFFTCSS